MTDPLVPTDEEETHRMPLIEHLRELQWRIIVSGIALVVGMAIGLIFYQPLYELLTAPIQIVMHGEPRNDMERFYLALTGPMRQMALEASPGGTLALTTSPLEGIYTVLRVGLIGGMVLASPVIAYQVWLFVAPGLYQAERRLVMPLALSSTVLFLAGMVFCYLVIFPVTFPFFLGVLDAEAVISVSGYLQTVVRMMATFGICFQLPVVTWFLARLGLIDHRDMIRGFRYAIVGMFIVAAILTPPEVLTQILLAVPLLLLYGLGVVIAWVSTTKVR